MATTTPSTPSTPAVASATGFVENCPPPNRRQRQLIFDSLAEIVNTTERPSVVSKGKHSYYKHIYRHRESVLFERDHTQSHAK